MGNNPLENRIHDIFNALRNPPDLKIRYMHKDEICLVHMEGIVDLNLCQESVIKPLLNLHSDNLTLLSIVNSLTAMKITIQNKESDIPNLLLNGSLIILENKSKQFLEIKLDKFDKRDINSPDLEVTLRGPKDGFIEDLSTNRSLIRRRLKSENLTIVSLKLGKYSNISAEIYYMDGIADPNLVIQIIDRIKKMKINYITDSSFIEKFLDRRKLKILPIIQNTQRPDTVASNLVEGRLAISVDGSPDVLILPAVFWQFMESPEDYYDLPIFIFFVKFLRLFSFFFSITLPSIYVAVTTFHWGLIPTKLLISFASARSGVPYPIILEVLLLEFVFEVLREAGLRFPKNVGQVISIVGALVIGEAAVQAGLVSAPTVIIVAFTGITSYIVPKYSFGSSARLLRFPLLVTSAIAGLPGLLLSFTVILAHFINTTSFGISYMSPISKVHGRSIKRWLLSIGNKEE
ncbi:spore germination protein [Paenibacillus sp. Root444D2]|uniref:spore germination protein n=1 Tax=Paenibacillus sp. Root444D2 TaxID=1736538 RepID=UPI00070B1F3B|nr:spore germination protein [Paenibacillus sp. Root444D2]KQX44655.1 hypothetical protein ASD40_21915 [Paenibacillus sp. Root444D2]